MYIITDSLIVERTSKSEYAHEHCNWTSTPVGNGPQVHRRGREVWRYWHNTATKICECQTAKEADKEVLRIQFLESEENGFRGNAPYPCADFESAVKDAVENFMNRDDADDAEERESFIFSQPTKRAQRAVKRRLDEVRKNT